MKLKPLLARLAACAALTVAAGVAQASPLLFTLTGNATASWQLDSSPVPKVWSDSHFDLRGVQGTFNGSSTSNTQLDFYTQEVGGGVQIRWDGIEEVNPASLQLFTGTTAAPTFLLGTFALVDYSDNSLTYTLTISAVAENAVPEPASLALVLGSLGLAGFTSTRRRTSKPCSAP